MSKALAGAALLVGGAALAFFSWGLSVPFDAALMSMIGSGIALEAGALAQKLGSNQGIGVSTRTAAGARQIVRGMRRIGGTIVYQSTTGAGGSSTSGQNYLFNYIIALATHEIDGIINLYLDGRQVYWSQDGNVANLGVGSVSTPPTATATISGGVITGIAATGGAGFSNVAPTRYRVRITGDGTGAQAYATQPSRPPDWGTSGVPIGTWVVTMVHGGSDYTYADIDIQGAYTFGGNAANDQQDPTLPGYGLGYGIGPGGPHYQFAGAGGSTPKVFCEARFGDQPPGDSMASLTYNDANWLSTARMGGCAYVYLQIGYDTQNFPSPPDIKFTITGKNDILDPRTGKTGYTDNWALVVADAFTDTKWGVGVAVNTAQLIAAANVCDELVSTTQGNEKNYCVSFACDTTSSPGDQIDAMLPAAAGRLSLIGGEIYLWPAYWQGSSFSFDQSALVATPQWSPYRSFRELINRVNGTYTAPNYPYGLVGNLYDANGWYYGVTNNLWPFAWQPTNFPQYAADVLHGYSSDVFLTEDGGQQLPLELELRTVISVVQAQRVAKIFLMRNRFQGSGRFRMFFAAFQMQPIDVMEFTMPMLGMSDQYLEIDAPSGEDAMRLMCEPMQDKDGKDGPLALTVDVGVVQTDPSVYEWSESEELTPEDVEGFPPSAWGVPSPPTSLALADNSTTAVVQATGVALPRVLVTWVPPTDPYVATGGTIQVQWQDEALTYLTGNWVDVGTFAGTATNCFIDGVSPVTAINVRVRALYANGTPSAWVYVNNFSTIATQVQLTGNFFVPATGNQVLTSSFADLPGIGSGSTGMMIALNGNACQLSVALNFSSASSGGGLTGIPGLSLPNTFGTGPPSITIHISGNGTGATAVVTPTHISGSGASSNWSLALSIPNAGWGYTTATATIITNSNGDPGYSTGTTTQSCTLSPTTALAGTPVTVQVLMDGAVVLGPTQVVTDAMGNVAFGASVSITPSSGSHVFEVQAETSSGSTVSFQSGYFQLLQAA